MAEIDSSDSSQFCMPEKPLVPLRRERVNGSERADDSTARCQPRNTHTRRDSSCQFPQMKEFSHFHYDQVELGATKFILQESPKQELHGLYTLQVVSQERFWTVHRGHDHFLLLDAYLHRCIYDRQVSQLQDLNHFERSDESKMYEVFSNYLSRLSDLTETSGSMMTCGTVLNFFELNNHGHRLMVSEDLAINIPAIAAAHCVHRHAAQAADELSLEVGDMVSVIDMPPAEDTNWWRGKKNFEVGLFPAECVEVIGGRTLPQQLANAEQVKPVLRRRGKLISFLRMFFSNRPQRSVLKQSGIVKERVFGCDLGEHLLNSGLQVPYVLTNCADFVETHGMTDGVYRLTGVASDIQKLRFSFDEGAVLDLSQKEFVSDLHSVTAVLKMYFRELPNPLLTYQLYGDFAATLHFKDEERLRRIQQVIRRLPPPNYRTAKRLFQHLHKMAQNVHVTGMDSRNLAIVWAPNLMRSKALDNGGSSVSGMSILNSVSLQATVTEFVISHANIIFSDDQAPTCSDNLGTGRKPRPTSAIICAPSRLLSLAEAQGRLLQLRSKAGGRPIDVAAIAINVNPVYHTIIEFPGERRRLRNVNAKAKDKPAALPSATTWKALFNKHSSGAGSKIKHKEKVKVTEDSAESEEEQQFSEIGHLSRKVQQGSLPSVKKAADDDEGRRVRLLSDCALLGNEEVKCATSSSSSSSGRHSRAGEPSLIRSTSHESFFEGEMAAVCTPGIVFRPAYKPKALSEIVQPLPAAMWRRTGHASKSPSPLSQSRIPYVAAPDNSVVNEKVQPYMLQRSPSVGRRSVMCFSSDADVSDLPDDMSPRCPEGIELPAGSSSCSNPGHVSTHGLLGEDQRSADGAANMSEQGGLPRLPSSAGHARPRNGRCGSVEAPSQAEGDSADEPAKVRGSSERLRELMSHWGSSDRLLVATLGMSARTSRHPSAQTAHCHQRDQPGPLAAGSDHCGATTSVCQPPDSAHCAASCPGTSSAGHLGSSSSSEAACSVVAGGPSASSGNSTQDHAASFSVRCNLGQGSDGSNIKWRRRHPSPRAKAAEAAGHVESAPESGVASESVNAACLLASAHGSQEAVIDPGVLHAGQRSRDAALARESNQQDSVPCSGDVTVVASLMTGIAAGHSLTGKHTVNTLSSTAGADCESPPLVSSCFRVDASSSSLGTQKDSLCVVTSYHGESGNLGEAPTSQAADTEKRDALAARMLPAGNLLSAPYLDNGDDDDACGLPSVRGSGQVPLVEGTCDEPNVLAGSSTHGDSKPVPPPRPSLRSHSHSVGEAAVIDSKPIRPRHLPPPSLSPTADKSTAIEETHSGSLKHTSTISPGQCAFRWITSPACIELPSPCGALPLPIGSDVLRQDTVPRGRPPCEPVPAHFADVTSQSTLCCKTAGQDSAVNAVRTSGLYSAVLLEAPKQAIAGLSLSPARVTVTSPGGVTSPDITDVFKAFSTV